jgi:hypothetical protein
MESVPSMIAFFSWRFGAATTFCDKAEPATASAAVVRNWRRVFMVDEEPTKSTRRDQSFFSLSA